MSIDLQFILRITYLITSILIVILPLTYAFPKVLKIFPFYRNALKALDKLRKLDEEEEARYRVFPFRIKELALLPPDKRNEFDKEEKRRVEKVKVGRVRKGDRGFDVLLRVIMKARRNLLEKKIVEIGLAKYGQNYELHLSRVTGIDIRPNAFVYFKEEGKNIREKLIFHPTAPEITLKLDELVGWVNDYAYWRSSFYTVSIAVVWCLILGFFVFGNT